MRRRAAIGLMLSAGLPRVVGGQSPKSGSPGRSRETPATDLLTPETQRVIDQGLAWLAARQHDDGSFGSGRYRHNVAVTSISAMAFLAAGHTPGRGRYSGQVERAIDAILDAAQPNGFIIREQHRSHGPMYGHGFATLLLAEVYGMDARPGSRRRVRDALKRAIELIVRSQNKEGGWRYQPQPVRIADLSVTVCQIMALRAARNCGIAVPKRCADRCIEYVKRCQNPDGGFRYTMARREGMFGVSAAGLVALASAGVYEGKEIERGQTYLMRFLPTRGVFRTPAHYFYGHYYAVQAMWHARGRLFERWYPAIRNQLITIRQPAGYWNDRNCTEYGTAMACLILQTPNSFLPIFQK